MTTAPEVERMRAEEAARIQVAVDARLQPPQDEHRSPFVYTMR
jgi:hypothetical protein